jgi:glycosyltransferase involved in cell wall biosynthesis
VGNRSFSVDRERTPTRSQPDAMAEIRVLSLVEANFVTGPAKSLMEFAAISGTPGEGLPSIRNVVAAFQRGSSGRTFLQSAKSAGLEVNVIQERFAFDPGVIPQLREIIKKERPHIIQSMNFKSHFLVRLLGLHRDCKWVALHHGYTWTNLKNTLYNQLDRWSLRKADMVVTVCVPFARELESFGVRPDRLLVQHNSIRPFSPASHQVVAELKSSLGIPEEAITLISVGRLSKEKGHIDLITAMTKVKADFKGSQTLRLVIVGDGPERPAIEDKVRELSLSDTVIFAGFQSEVSPYYQIADVAVLPSHSEGSPYALLEAMAAGVPMVATAVGGVPEIATNGENALLVNRESPVQLAAGILELVGNAQLRQKVSVAGKERVRFYDPKTYRRNMVELYRRVLLSTAR